MTKFPATHLEKNKWTVISEQDCYLQNVSPYTIYVAELDSEPPSTTGAIEVPSGGSKSYKHTGAKLWGICPVGDACLSITVNLAEGEA